MSNELAIQDPELLKLLAGMANRDDGGGSVTGPPTLKINYSKRATHPMGEWVVGQKKAQDGSIAEEGELVKGLVILLARNRWSFYNQKDTTQNCNSPFYLRGEIVVGSNYGHICGKSCPRRAEGIDPRCKCQIVLFGKAVTAQGKFIDCISYLGGDSYMPTQSYIESIETLKVQGGYLEIPLFSHLTLLGAVEKTNQGTDYYQVKFTKGPMFKDSKQLLEFDNARKEALQYIERSNAVLAEKKEKEPATGTSPDPVAPASVSPATTVTEQSPTATVEVISDAVVQAAPAVNVPDFANLVTGSSIGTARTETATVVEAPIQEPPQAGGDNFNLLGAIQGLIDENK